MLRIPFQDTRSDGNRRWSDMLKWKRLRVDEINDLINRCEVLDRKDLMALRTTINRRLETLPPAG
jgi:hypothetical protein